MLDAGDQPVGNAGSALGKQDANSRPLMDVLLARRSRRFAFGSTLQGSALAYHSDSAPVPLSIDEEAILAFASIAPIERLWA